MDAILIVELDLSGKQVVGDYRGMATIDGVVLKIARCNARQNARHAGKSK